MPFIGIGKSGSRNSRAAGEEAAIKSLEGIQGGKPRIALVFASAGHDQQEVLNGVRRAVGEVPISGCSASGIITRGECDDATHGVGVLTITHPGLSFTTFLGDHFGKDSAECGRRLADQIREKGPRDGKLLLLFPDGLTGNVSVLLETLEAGIPFSVAIAGGTAGELLKMGATWQYHDGKAATDSVAAVLIGGELATEIAVAHGCDPIGIEQVVTRAEGGWVHEIDGKPAWEIYRQYLDLRESDVITMSHFCYICLAELLPEPDPLYGRYIIRCPLRVDRSSGALFFPGEMKTGTRVRMALRSAEATVARGIKSAEAIRARHGGADPFLVFQFDCCCRGRMLFGARTYEEAVGPVQRTLGDRVPWLGFNTYGEIAALRQGRTLFHNYSMVLCALYPTDRAPEGGWTNSNR